MRAPPPEPQRAAEAGVEAPAIMVDEIFGESNAPPTTDEAVDGATKCIDEIAELDGDAGAVAKRMSELRKKLSALDHDTREPLIFDAARRIPTVTRGSLRAGIKRQEQRDAMAVRASGILSTGADGKVSQADRLVVMARERYELGVTDEGEPFAVAKDGPRIARSLRGSRHSLRVALAAAYHEANGKAPSSTGLTDALATLEGYALQEPATRLYLRTAQVDGEVWIDLGRHDGVVVRVDAADWVVMKTSPMLFRRTVLTGELPIPEQPGDVDVLQQILGLEDKAWALIRAWLVGSMFPNIPRPALLLTGEQGSAKSTTTKMLVGLVDPSPAATRCMPREERDWIVATASSAVVALDNVSYMPAWLSDAICRAVTGEGFARRRLYTDSDTAVTRFKRAIILNGIDVGATRGDLLDRLVPVELHRLDEQDRRTEAQLWQQYEGARPVILGGLLDLVSAVLRYLPMPLERPPRMADFAEILAALDKATGSSALETYVDTQGQALAGAVDADHVARAVIALVNDVGTWSGIATDLLKELDARRGDERAPKGWPTTPNHLSGKLRRVAPAVRASGFVVEDSKYDNAGRRIWELGRVHDTDPDSEGESSSGPSASSGSSDNEPDTDGPDDPDGEIPELSGRHVKQTGDPTPQPDRFAGMDWRQQQAARLREIRERDGDDYSDEVSL